MSFQEFTFIQPEHQAEFMVDIDTQSLKIIDCYTYIKDVQEVREKEGDYLAHNSVFKRRWKVGNNALFGHNKNAFKAVFAECVVCPDNDEEFEFLHRVMKANNIEVSEVIEP